MRIDVHIYSDDSVTAQILKNVLRKLTQIQEALMTTQEGIDQLKAKVSAQTTVIQSAVTLLGGLAQQIRDSKDDPEELQKLADSLDANTGDLSKAVTENTPTP